MGILVLIAGLILFLGPHVFVTLRPLRATVVKAIGEWPYKAIFSVVSIAALYLIGKGFGMYYSAGPIDIWYPPAWTRHITETLMLLACISVAAAYLPGRIKLTLKHPMLVGVKTWALAHLLANGDLGGIILFGAVLAWAVYDRITLKHRSDPGAPPIAPGGLRNDIAAVIVGIVIYGALFFPFHTFVIGRPLLATAFGT
jgi:uncharacterized membrane protein